MRNIPGWLIIVGIVLLVLVIRRNGNGGNGNGDLPLRPADMEIGTIYDLPGVGTVEMGADGMVRVHRASGGTTEISFFGVPQTLPGEWLYFIPPDTSGSVFTDSLANAIRSIVT